MIVVYWGVYLLCAGLLLRFRLCLKWKYMLSCHTCIWKGGVIKAVLNFLGTINYKPPDRKLGISSIANNTSSNTNTIESNTYWTKTFWRCYLKDGHMEPPWCILSLWMSVTFVSTQQVFQLTRPKTWFLSLLHLWHVMQLFFLSRCIYSICECAVIKVSPILLEHLHYITEKGNPVVYLSACNVAQGVDQGSW